MSWNNVNLLLAAIPKPEKTEEGKQKEDGQDVYYMDDSNRELEAEFLSKINKR